MALTTMYHPYYAQNGQTGPPSGLLPPYMVRYPGYPTYGPVMPFSQLTGMELSFPMPAAYSAAMLAMSGGADYSNYYMTMAEMQGASTAHRQLDYDANPYFGVGMYQKEVSSLCKRRIITIECVMCVPFAAQHTTCA